MLPDDPLSRGQFGGRTTWQGCPHLVAHPAGELIALLFELIEQQLHPLGLLGYLRR